MKRILSMLILLLLCVSVFAGCEKPDAESLIAKHENDCENIDQKLASEIKIAYSQYTNDVNYGGEHRFTPEDICILRYEGEVGGCHFVMLGGDEIDYTTAFRSVEVAGYVVEFSSGQPMYAYKDGIFYTLKQAYDNGILTDSDVYDIGMKVDPSFAERYATPDSTSGKRLPIEMTIAETLPSCVAFEYKDAKPYCFYAYDNNGKLYRVLWNNFDGLNEKDRIVVDHNDVIETLSYDEYPDGGWTPQYEITAISVFTINSTGTRIYDDRHPDDSERYPFFSVTLPVLNNAKVEHREDSKIYVDGEYLLGGSGNGCNSFYLSDLTGDGVPELCFGMNFGSGIVDQRIEIVDYATRETLFSLSGRGTNDYYLFMRNGILCVKETEYMKHDAVRTGVLTYNGSEISVTWDSEVNATVDRDISPAPGEPVS